MTEIVQKVHIVEDTTSNSDITLIFSGNETKMTNNLRTNPIILDPKKEYKIGLFNLETYYSFGNVDSTNNIFTYSTDSGSTWHNITITPGAYGTNILNATIQRLMRTNGHWDATNEKYYITLSANNATLRAVFEIDNANYQIDFTTVNNLRNILGFDSVVLSNSYNEGTNIVNIMPINSIHIHCDIISDSFVNGNLSQVLYNFFPGVSPGYKIIEKPYNIAYMKIYNKEQIDHITVWLTDQNDKLINLNGENLSLRLIIKRS